MRAGEGGEVGQVVSSEEEQRSLEEAWDDVRSSAMSL